MEVAASASGGEAEETTLLTPTLSLVASVRDERLAGNDEVEETPLVTPTLSLVASVRDERLAGGGKWRRDTGRLVDSTQAEDRRMIALVSARPLLYARSTLPVASYYSQVKRLWQEVADIMGWTVAEVRRKWSHIRNSYSRHLRNEMHGMRTGKGRMVSKWYLADELEFLRQHMATDTRPSYSMMSSFPPSLLEMEVLRSEDEDTKPPSAGAWYSVPEPAPTPAYRTAPGPPPAPDDSCGAHSFEPEETAPYFQFFRSIYKDYEELPPMKQRMFRRKCLILLHELVDGEEGARGVEKEAERRAGEGEGYGDGEDSAMNLSTGNGSDSEREHKFFVKDLQPIINCGSEETDDNDTR